MPINREFFFYHVRLHLFDGSMKQSQVNGLNGFLDKWEAEMPDADDRWLAYILGTAHHETGRTMLPVRETFATSDAQAISRLQKAFDLGNLPWVKTPYWIPDSEGKSWFGRGYVQLTHKSNYVKMSTVTGEDLTGNPSRAMDPTVALKIIFEGMKRGSFTGKKLADYFNPSKEDWYNARRIINGIESADLVASHGRKYYAAISYTTG